MPRIDESMLSINGSPLANPFEVGKMWAAATTASEPQGPHQLKRTKSNITISRDPSHSSLLSRSNSQASLLADPSHPSSSSQHSRSSSEATDPTMHQSQPNPTSHAPFTPPQHSYSQPLPQRPDVTPLPGTLTRSYSVKISTKDGHLLEFDPLQASPGSLDALEGITASAKKKAREDIGRLVLEASEKWRID